jgi:hypothetical protein
MSEGTTLHNGSKMTCAVIRPTGMRSKAGTVFGNVPGYDNLARSFPPFGKGIWAWILLTMLIFLICSGFNLLIGIIMMFCAMFIAEGMGWKH